MKKVMFYVLLIAILCMGMTGKSKVQTVGKLMVPTISFDNGDTAAVAVTSPMNGLCRQIEVDVAEDTSNNITVTVAVTTEDGGSLFSAAGIVDNGSTILRGISDKAVQDADFDAFLAAETVTITVTPSGDPGATGATVNVGFYLE